MHYLRPAEMPVRVHSSLSWGNSSIPVWIAQEIDEHSFIVLLILDLCHGFLFRFAFLELIGHILKSRVLLGFSLELH